MEYDGDEATTMDRIINLSLIGLISFITTTFVNAAEPAKPSLTIMPLRKFDAIYGCGCSFHYPPQLQYRGAPILK
jgi:hypothetical protein